MWGSECFRPVYVRKKSVVERYDHMFMWKSGIGGNPNQPIQWNTECHQDIVDDFPPHGRCLQVRDELDPVYGDQCLYDPPQHTLAPDYITIL